MISEVINECFEFSIFHGPYTSRESVKSHNMVSKSVSKYLRTGVRQSTCGQLLNVYNGVYFYGDFLGQPSIDGLDSVQIVPK